MTTDLPKPPPHPKQLGEADLLDGWIVGESHFYLLRVQYEDTDAGGIVYHSNYISFAERARSACLRCLDIRQEDALAALQGGDETAVMLVVRRVEVDFVMAAGLGTPLCVETRMLKLGGASMKLQQTITNFKNGHILARLLVDIGCVAPNLDGGKRPRRMPSVLADRLRQALSD